MWFKENNNDENICTYTATDATSRNWRNVKMSYTRVPMATKIGAPAHNFSWPFLT